ncbi:MAG: phosphodiester glycosidase family protein [Polyangiaceae bacterium]|nr:phosphodiester glycosidase family protein [Polyangiaceae bacterium]NUQ79244.1 phosphodiester glycosidase family protein [Polyangiaceae bacterium]
MTTPSRFRRRAVIALATSALVVEGLWYGIHHVPGFGPAVADGVRAVLGPAPVAWAENIAYGVADTVNRWRYKDAPPKTFWEAPPESIAASTAPASPIEKAAPGEPSEGAPATESFPPPAYAPPYANVASKGDGIWIPIGVGKGDTEPPAMVKSLVHPDPKRSFAAVAIVAMDLQRLDLRVVSGLKEPASSTVPIERRRGLIAKEDMADVVAAWNGGFKATHGHYGMMIDGDTFLPPKETACTMALYRDGSVKIRTWPSLSASEPSMAAYRQTPPCLVEQGELNPELSEYNRSWGSTVSGETIIRRSAIGIDTSGRVLFYALGEAVTSEALGRAMKVAGAVGAAQLDVNHAYPRFLMFEQRGAGQLPIATQAIIPDIEFEKWDYTIEPSPRDFFYIKRRRTSS